MSGREIVPECDKVLTKQAPSGSRRHLAAHCVFMFVGLNAIMSRFSATRP